MGELHLLRPLWLWSLVPAVLIWFGLWRLQDETAAWKKIFDPLLLEHLSVGTKTRRLLRPIHLALVVGALCAMALAGPTWQREPSPFADDQAGLVVLLKASATMEATDVQPSRLERAKHKLRDLLELRDGSSTGLIVYSGSAHLVMPLTRDDRMITAMAAEISPGLMPVNGDALGEALELAANLLDRAGVPGSVLVMADSVAPSQVAAGAEAAPDLPVQFLAVKPPNATIDAGLQQLANDRGTSVRQMAVDEADVQRLALRAQSDFRAAPVAGGGERWRDAGYYLLPLIALLALAWSRKGWIVT